MSQTAEVTPDGWIVTDLRAFRVLTEHAPPRPWGYRDQIRADAHEPAIIVTWVTAVGLIAAGVGLTAAAAVTEPRGGVVGGGDDRAQERRVVAHAGTYADEVQRHP
jgi:hypothetical protein